MVMREKGTFEAWPAPAIVDLRGNWVGDLPAMPVLMGGTVPPTPMKLGEVADALLSEKYEQARTNAYRLRDIFGKSNCLLSRSTIR